VEFTFDMSEDTAECIANEMMEDLSLSADQAAYIADKIKDEIKRMGSEFVDRLDLSQHQHGQQHEAGHMQQQQYSGSGAAAPAGTVQLDGAASGELDPAVREAVVANAAAAAVTAFASAAAAANSSGGGAYDHQQQPLQQQESQAQPSVTANGGATRSKSGYNSPRETGRPPSYHDLARAMREFHEQQLAAEAAQRAAAAAAADTGSQEGMHTPSAHVGGCGGMLGTPMGAAAVPVPIALGMPGQLIDPQSLVVSGALESPPLEVRLPNGHALDPAVLAKVAATAATAAASALNEVMPARHGQQQSPVCTVSGFSDCSRQEAA
jgi:hypothetical protein